MTVVAALNWFLCAPGELMILVMWCTKLVAAATSCTLIPTPY